MPDGTQQRTVSGVAISYRFEWDREIRDGASNSDFVEIVAEDFLVDGGARLQILDDLRRRYEVVVHCLSGSIGSEAPAGYLRAVRELSDRIDPRWLSDHLCWTGTDTHRLHDLLPVPFTQSCARHVADRAKAVQDATGRLLAIENLGGYLALADSRMSEWDFFASVTELADCGILLDLTNLAVTARNLGFAPSDYLDGLPGDRVVQYHLAGHAISRGVAIDSHDCEVDDTVWELFDQAVRRFGPRPTVVEWDARIPEYESARGQLERAREIVANAA